MTDTQRDPPTVLVVDDEALLRWRAADLLASAGYQVVEADDAASALRIMEQRRDVRLLFTDVQMPGPFDGMELARQVHDRWPHVLLLVTSGHPGITTNDVPDDGHFVPKPYLPDDLVGQVDDLIAGRK